MKALKKISAILLAIVLVFSTNSIVFAEEGNQGGAKTLIKILDCNDNPINDISYVVYEGDTEKTIDGGEANFLPGSYTIEFEYDEERYVFMEDSSCTTITIVNTDAEYILSGLFHVIDPELRNYSEPTCTVDGYTGDVYCSVCDELLTKGEIVNAGHYYVIDDAVPPGCTSTGLKAGAHCGRCNEVFLAQAEIPATGHNYGEWETVRSQNCTEKGSEQRTCSVCGDTQSREVDEKGHTEVTDEAVPPTCTEPGKTAGSHCSECNAVIVEQEVIPAKGHTEVTDEAVAPTCTEPGKTAGSHCSVCNAVIVEQEVVSATGHTWNNGAVTTAATCEAAGVKTFTCKTCKATKTETIAATGHKWNNGTVTKAATCETAGEKSFICLNCGKTKKEAVSALGHKEVTDKAVAATCASSGLTAGKHCSRCNKVLVAQEIIDKKEHKWSNGKCKNCSAKDTVLVNKFCNLTDDSNIYFIGEQWRPDATFLFKYEQHDEIYTVTADELVSQNILKGFDTTEKNTNINCKFVYRGVEFQGPQVKCFDSYITFIADEGTGASSFSQRYKSDTKSFDGSTTQTMGNNGLKYQYQLLIRDSKITLSPEAKKVVTMSNKMSSWSIGNLEIKPKNGYFDVGSDAKKYYILVTGEAYGKQVSYKIYIKYGVSSLFSTTASETYELGKSVKSKKISFKEIYVDDTSKVYTVSKKPDTSSVGEKSISFSHGGKKAKYSYRVRCKAPSIKVKASKKAVTVSWKKVKGATGYKVYRATSKNGKYTCVKTIKSAKTLKFKNTGLKSKQTYYYKVVATYSKNSNCDSSASAVKSCKAK